MPDGVVQIVVTTAVSLLLIAGGYISAKRLGLDNSQKTLNTVLKDLNQAWGDKLKLLEEDFEHCKMRLESVEHDREKDRDEIWRLRRRIEDMEKRDARIS